jgi:pimeloyl-ACP methyl ester carboxylesterase
MGRTGRVERGIMPQESFDALFSQVPVAQTRALQRFWHDYSYEERVIGKARWRYLRVGRSRRTVLLLPHPLAPADMWFHLAASLAPHFRCLIPDGYALQQAYDADFICEALVRIIEAEGAYSVAVVAHSGGGSVAQFLLQRYPHRVQHLVLCHSVALDRWAPMPLRAWRWALGWAPWKLLQQRLPTALDPGVSADGRWSAFTRAYVGLITQDLARETVQGFWSAEQMMRLRFENRTPIDVGWPGRVLALASADDPLSADSLDLFDERYPRCQTVSWGNGGHWGPLQYPEHLAQEIVGFLTDDTL